jgi:hypothetical protein
MFEDGMVGATIAEGAMIDGAMVGTATADVTMTDVVAIGVVMVDVAMVVDDAGYWRFPGSLLGLSPSLAYLLD